MLDALACAALLACGAVAPPMSDAISPPVFGAIEPQEQGQAHVGRNEPSRDPTTTAAEGGLATIADEAAEPKTDPGARGADDEIVVTGRKAHPGDPLQAINAKSFAATQSVDHAVLEPVALAYRRNVPGAVRDGVRNFFKNLREPVVAANYLLQLKPGKAAETVGRFAINTTIGVAGVVDVAKRRPFRLPRRPNGFADTLGYYGVGPGAFFFLPLLGPTTVRDLAGGFMDRLMIPLYLPRGLRHPQYAIPATVLGTLDRRAEFDDDLRVIRDSADPYAARRDFYLRKRQREIDALHGRHANEPPQASDPPSSIDQKER